MSKTAWSKPQSLFNWREFAALAAMGVIMFVMAAKYELFEAFYEASRAHESWELDELVLLVPIVAILLAIFAARRVMQLRRSIAATALLEAQARIEAVTNRVTRLPNDHATFQAIEAVLQSGAAGQGVTIVVRDPTRRDAEKVNGHGAGDQPCRDMIERLRAALPPRSIIGSLDTDATLVFVPGIHSQAEAGALIEKILPAVNAPLQVGHVLLTPRVKIGASMVKPGHKTILPTVEQAMLALDQSMRKGECKDIAFFDAAFEAEQAATQAMQVKLAAALNAGQLECAFQPIVNLLSGSTIAFEALARWQPPGENPVPPDVFIPMIERLGLMPKFTELMLDKALRCARTWPKEIGISINLSSLQLVDAELSRRVFRSLQAHGVASSRVELELTEQNDLVGNVSTQPTIMMLRSLGVKIVVDDFGAGHANFNLLHNIHFDGLKIDRNLVKDIRKNAKDKAMVEAIVSLTSALKRDLTIEGVEDEATAELLRNIGCRRAQGYHFARPMPASETLDFLQRRRTVPGLRASAA